MITKQLIIITMALSLSAACLLAQNDGPPQGGPPQGGQNDGPPGGPPDGPGRGPRHRPPPLPIMEALDTNHDGILSAEEIANAPAALKTLDKNGDGQLTRDEYMPPRPPRRDGMGPQDAPPPPPPADSNEAGQGRPHRPPPPIVAALDTNGDGIISADEIANASASLLKLDKNGDGQLTRDELRPQGPPPSADGRPGGPDEGGPPPPPPGDGGPGGPGSGGPPPPSPGQNQ